MGLSKQQLKRFMEEGKNDENKETFIATLKKYKVSGKYKDYLKKTPFKSVLKKLALKDTNFYQKKIGLSPADFVKSRKVYERLGQHDYQDPDYTEDITELTGTSTKGNKWVYIGQLKVRTETKDGIGIMVWSNGYIYEGYWKNNKMNGKGRLIYPEGDYYVGEWKNGNRHGLGTYWSEDGDRYNGLHKDGQRHGKGYYYWSDGRIDP